MAEESTTGSASATGASSATSALEWESEAGASMSSYFNDCLSAGANTIYETASYTAQSGLPAVATSRYAPDPMSDEGIGYRSDGSQGANYQMMAGGASSYYYGEDQTAMASGTSSTTSTSSTTDLTSMYGSGSTSTSGSSTT